MCGFFSQTRLGQQEGYSRDSGPVAVFPCAPSDDETKTLVLSRFFAVGPLHAGFALSGRVR